MLKDDIAGVDQSPDSDRWGSPAEDLEELLGPGTSHVSAWRGSHILQALPGSAGPSLVVPGLYVLGK